jgi:hypothetical protein
MPSREEDSALGEQEFGVPSKNNSRQMTKSAFGAGDLESARIGEGKTYNAKVCLLLLSKR